MRAIFYVLVSLEYPKIESGTDIFWGVFSRAFFIKFSLSKLDHKLQDVRELSGGNSTSWDNISSHPLWLTKNPCVNVFLVNVRRSEPGHWAASS